MQHLEGSGTPVLYIGRMVLILGNGDVGRSKSVWIIFFSLQ